MTMVGEQALLGEGSMLIDPGVPSLLPPWLVIRARGQKMSTQSDWTVWTIGLGVAAGASVHIDSPTRYHIPKASFLRPDLLATAVRRDQCSPVRTQLEPCVSRATRDNSLCYCHFQYFTGLHSGSSTRQ